VGLFQRALEMSPGSPDIQKLLAEAQQRVSAGEASRGATSADNPKPLGAPVPSETASDSEQDTADKSENPASKP